MTKEEKLKKIIEKLLDGIWVFASLNNDNLTTCYRFISIESIPIYVTRIADFYYVSARGEMIITGSPAEEIFIHAVEQCLESAVDFTYKRLTGDKR